MTREWSEDDLAQQAANLEWAEKRSNKRMNLYLAILEEETTHKRPWVLWWYNLRIWLLK
jgi:hypothetical protein